MDKRTCLFCKAEYETYKPQQRYCSPKCLTNMNLARVNHKWMTKENLQSEKEKDLICIMERAKRME